MAPTSSQSSQSKQKSISSFFTPKTASRPSNAINTTSSTFSAFANNSKDTPVATNRAPIEENDGTEHEAGDVLPSRGVKRALSTEQRSNTKRIRRTSEDYENVAPSSPQDIPTPISRPAQSPKSPVSNRTLSNGEKLSQRTSRYVFSQESEPPEDDEDAKVRKQKELLHQRFVKKLGRPDAMIELKRRNRMIDEETAQDQDEDEDMDQEEEEAPKQKSKKPAKKGAAKLTPMERQVIDIKKKNMDTLLVVEVGYKYRFFGEDARIAAKELQIMCIPGKFRYDEHPSEAHLDRFASASFPTHRLHVHVKRLVQAGHKVGVVRQLETAALKAVGDNRNAPFVRQLTNLYTKGTYIDDTEGIEGIQPQASSGYLLCLTETNAKGWGTDEKVRLGLVAVQPTTGDIIYDDFEDGFMRSELETRLLHISPCEFLIVGQPSKATEKLVSRLAASRTSGKSERIERVNKPKTMAAQAYSHISNFYADKVKKGLDDESDGTISRDTALLDKAHQLSELVTICLSAMIIHLTAYGLEHVFDLTKYFQPFSARSYMLLNGNTLSSLEIYNNQTDYTPAGSLLWTLNKTQTRFGQRMLRNWVGRPLLDQSRLTERLEAVEELMASHMSADRLRRLLRQIKGDLEKSLIRIYYKKCTRPELVTVLQTLQVIANEYVDVKSSEKGAGGFSSPILCQAIAALPCISDDVVSFLERINLGAAKDDDKYGFFREEFETEAVSDHKVGIVSIEYDLDEQKKVIAEKLRKSKVAFATCAGIEYLVEVDNTQLKHVPASWAKISGTKKLSRFHTPDVIKLMRERDQHKEALANACDAAFTDLLGEIGAHYQSFRDCIQALATLDCLLSLAEVSSLPGYCKPEFVDSSETRIEISGGRHPMVEQILLDSYVPNDIDLASSGTRALLVTGPNMGGKSSYVRSIALISIMAQIGCFVPASSAKLSLLDAIFTRMGAFDNMMKGESTFMVELNETSDILKQATPRSLVILDELGRGTSTHDGVAIAQAVLEYMLERKSLTLFITHYQALARMADRWEPLKNVHMKFTEDEAEGSGGEKEITFLYEVGEGTAHRSYGLNVARLAGLSSSIIDVAAVKSKELELEETRRRVGYLQRLMPEAIKGDEGRLDDLVEAIGQLG